MKIWLGFGSEHSANLVMIGRFETPNDAEVVLREFEELRDGIVDAFDQDAFDEDRLSVYRQGPLRDLVERLGLWLSPEDFEHFVREHHVRRHGKELRIHTDESDVNGLLKFLIERRARVEIYSAHHHSDDSSKQS